MTTRSHGSEAAITGTAAALAGIGAVTLALFPLAIPFLVLTAVFVAPLAILGIVPVLLVGAVLATGTLIGRLGRRARGRGKSATGKAAPAGRAVGAASHAHRGQTT